MRRLDLAALAVLAFVAAPILVAARGAQDRARLTQCANNLSQLWKMQNYYMVQYGGPQKRMPQETGDAFWLKLSRKPAILIDSTLRDLYQCPVENVDEGEGTCDYRGPSSDVNAYGDGDPVGADVDGNHGPDRGGCVLRKSGDVQIVKPNEALWARAAEKTTGGSPVSHPKVSMEHTPKQLQAFVRLAHLYISIMLYHELEGDFPKSLRDLVEKPREAKAWPEGGYLPEGRIPKDPWGNDFQYKNEAGYPRLWTWGADGKDGGSGENQELTLEDLTSRGGGPRLQGNEANAAGSLKTIATAQMDFRSNDRDNNRVNDFWTGDIAGLYCIGSTAPIKLIEIAIALADAEPRPGLTIGGEDQYSTRVETFGKRAPKAGYWFVAMEEDRSTDPPTAYARNTGNAVEDKHNTSRFGACAYPAEYGKSGTKTFILNEGNTMFWKDTGGRPVEAWPTDEELARDWKKLD